MDSEQHWWFCLRHNTVESDDVCPGRDRLGPYPTREAAERALETVQERNQAWDAQD
jgi:hypothetical protein